MKELLMAKVILLSDNTSAGYLGISRYAGPYALASALEKQNITTHIVDYISRCTDFWSIFENLVEHDTLVVGISTTFMSPLNKRASLSGSNTERIDNAFDYVSEPIIYEDPIRLDQWIVALRQILKSKAPSAKILLGGAKLQFLFERPDLYSEVDYVVFGQADHIISDLVFHLQENKVPEFIMFNNRRILSNASNEKKSHCPKIVWNPKWGIQDKEALPVEVSRGCLFNCKFCHYDKKESFRKEVIDFKAELIYNFETFGTQYYHFCDDCFNDHPEKVKIFCNAILSLPFKIEWVSYARVDVAIKFPETVDLMIKSGARGLFWGLESFNYEVARSAGKGTHPDKVKKFLKSFYDNYGSDCTSSGSFIVGLPGETLQTQNETIDWVVNSNALHFIDVMPLKLRPYYKNFDMRMTDFADYSRSPEKYGFKKVDFNNYFWEHSSMNSEEAYQLTKEFNYKWKINNHDKIGLTYSIWTYPHLRGLGYTAQEVREIQTNPKKKEFYYSDVPKKFTTHLDRYFSMMRGKNL